MAQDTQELTLTVYGRKTLGKSGSYRMRVANMVPAIVYGPKLEKGLPVSVKPRDVQLLYKKAGATALVTLTATEGAPAELSGTKILFKEIQVHPIKPRILHVDMHQLDLARKVRVTVPLKFIGKAKGVAEGGILSVVTRQVEIKALPLDIPNHIDVDVSDLDVNDTIHVEDLSKKMAGGKFEFIYEANYSLVGVQIPQEEAAATPVAGDPAAAAAAGAPAAAGAAAPAAGAKGAAPAAGAKAPAAAPAKGGDKK